MGWVFFFTLNGLSPHIKYFLAFILTTNKTDSKPKLICFWLNWSTPTNHVMRRRQFIHQSAILGVALASPTILGSQSGILSTGTYRKVHQILNADKTKVGTLPIMRAFAGNHLDYVSPYVLFDEFGPVDLNAGDDPLRVDAHPHAGIIPTTYFLAGSGHHKDSLDYDFQVGKGEFMMFSSGKGAIHMEETGQKLYDEGGEYHGFSDLAKYASQTQI